MTIVSNDWRLGPDTNTLDYPALLRLRRMALQRLWTRKSYCGSIVSAISNGRYRVADESLPDDLLYDNFGTFIEIDWAHER